MSLRRFFAVLVFLGVALPLSAQSPAARIMNAPLVFEPNQGQAPSSVRFLSRSNGHSFFLMNTETVLAFADPALTVRMRLIGQNPRPDIEGIDLQSGVSNYFLGNDPSQWRRAVPHFAKVKYADVYPGIDVIYYGRERQLEYDFDVHPHEDPSVIQFEFQGTAKIALGAEGDLILDTAEGQIRHRRPVALQERDGAIEHIEARFVLRGNRVGFEVGTYDHTLPLIIDPKLVWSSFLGSSGNDQGNDIAVDSNGSTYVTGYTTSAADTEPAGALDPGIDRNIEAFVTKVDSGGGVVYTTYLGGTGADEAHSLALDPSGSIYITGLTASSDFPLVNAFQSTLGGVQDAYILKLSPNGDAIQFSSYLGGTENDRGYGIAVDAFGNAFITGATFSADFPVSNAFQSTFGGGLGDAFVTAVTAGGTVEFSTFLGGNGNDQAYDVGVDSEQNIVVTGFTTSQNFPTAHAFYTTYRGGSDDTFITKLDSTGKNLVFSTYLGGTGSDDGVSLAIDRDKNIYVTGYTSSLNFPLKRASQVLQAGSYDAFLIKLYPDGQNVEFSTYIGGEDLDSAVSVAVDDAGFIYLTGYTNSFQFYSINAISGQAFRQGLQDAFVMKLTSDASVIVYSSYLGGVDTDGGTGIAVDGEGNIYVTGFTFSSNFPVSEGAFQGSLAGARDAFVVKINGDDVTTSSSFSFLGNGGAEVATAGNSSQVVFGYAEADVETGLSPSGLEILELGNTAGIPLDEVSIPVPKPTLAGRLVALTGTTDSTALTIMNPNDEDVAIDFYFTSLQGVSDHFGSFTLPAHAQNSGFVTATPFNFPADTMGTLTFTADEPVIAIALRVETGIGTNTVNSYVPMIDPDLASDHQSVMPQFADGNNWSTQFVLVNPTDDAISGEIRLFKNPDAGQPGTPAELFTSRGMHSVFAYSIPPRAAYMLETLGETSQLLTGFAEIVPTEGSDSPLAYATLHDTDTGFSATTVEAMEPASEFRMYAEISGTFPDDLAAMPAVALANSTDAPATVDLALTGFDGTDSGLSTQVTLPPKGHLSAFLHEIPGFESLPSPYAGILHVSTAQPGVTFAGFRARYSQLRHFLVTATGPLQDAGNVNPIVFPHLVDGGGYASRFIVISGSSGGSSSGTIRYFDQSGDPLNVATAP